eukprot:7520348-Lingulodinium_polyedra.AAC.1
MATAPRPALTETISGAYKQETEGDTPVTTCIHAKYDKLSGAKSTQSTYLITNARNIPLKMYAQMCPDALNPSDT